MNRKTISIADDFSIRPRGRYPKDDPNSGQRFREELLAPALNEYDQVTVVIDGVLGYGSSFLEEAFGGLVRERGFSEKDLRRKLVIEHQKPSFESFKISIWEYITDAEQLRTAKSKRSR